MVVPRARANKSVETPSALALARLSLASTA